MGIILFAILANFKYCGCDIFGLTECSYTMLVVYLNVSNTKLKLFLPATRNSLQGSEVKFSIFIYKFLSQPLIGINVSENTSYFHLQSGIPQMYSNVLNNTFYDRTISTP